MLPVPLTDSNIRRVKSDHWNPSTQYTLGGGLILMTCCESIPLLKYSISVISSILFNNPISKIETHGI